MKSNILISTLIMILFLVGCNPKEEKKTNIPDMKFNIPQTDLTPPDLVVFEAANSIYGEWVYIDTDHYSKLLINRDGTFRHFNEKKIY